MANKDINVFFPWIGINYEDIHNENPCSSNTYLKDKIFFIGPNIGVGLLSLVVT